MTFQFTEAFGKVGGRKLALAVLSIIVGTLVDIFSGKGLSTNLLTLLTGVYGGFAIGNIGEHVANKKKKKEVEEIPPAQIEEAVIQGGLDLSSLDERLARVENQLIAISEISNLNGQGIGYIVEFIKSNTKQGPR